MKKIVLFFVVAAIIAGFGACKKAVDKPTDEAQTPAPTQYPTPVWTIDQTGKYPVSMTAVVNLPPALQANLSDGDKLGAFVNDECRGEGTIVTIENSKVFFVLINGTPSEQSTVKFKYYSKRTSFLYESATALIFTVDDNYGTASKPETLNLVAVK